MNIKYSLGADPFEKKYDQIQKCRPNRTYVLDTDNIQIIPEDVRRYIMNDVATISRVWDKSSVIAGTKTVVKCQPGDKFDPEKGLAMAIVKKTMGNTGSYCNVFKKWVNEVKRDGEV